MLLGEGLAVRLVVEVFRRDEEIAGDRTADADGFADQTSLADVRIAAEAAAVRTVGDRVAGVGTVDAGIEGIGYRDARVPVRREGVVVLVLAEARRRRGHREVDRSAVENTNVGFRGRTGPLVGDVVVAGVRDRSLVALALLADDPVRILGFRVAVSTDLDRVVSLVEGVLGGVTTGEGPSLSVGASNQGREVRSKQRRAVTVGRHRESLTLRDGVDHAHGGLEGRVDKIAPTVGYSDRFTKPMRQEKRRNSFVTGAC